MDRAVLLDNEIGPACDIAGASRRPSSVAQIVLLWTTTVATLAIAWAPEATRAASDPVRLAASAQQAMDFRNINSAAAAEDGNSEAAARDGGGTKRSVLTGQGAAGQSVAPSDQEHWGERLSCELSTARLDIGLLQRIEHERERVETLEQRLAAARRDVEVQTALATKAVNDAARVEQAVQGAAELRDALQQANERAGRLEQDLVAARRDAEVQTALAEQAGREASRLKRAGESGAAETRRPPARVEALAGDASLTRSAIRAYEAQAGAVGADLVELGQATASDTGSFHNPERFARLEQDLAVARGELEAQTTIAMKASEEASRLRQSGERERADLQQEREQSGRLERDLATARRDLEIQVALATKASEEASRLKAAGESGTAKLELSLQQERDRSAGLDRELAAARHELGTQTALATKASEEISRLKAAEESGTPELQKEKERSTQLEQDLTTARRDLAAQVALAAKAGEEVSRLKLSVEAVAVDLRQSRAKADALAQELSQARSSAYAYEAQALKAGEEVAELRRVTASSAHKASPDELGQLARLEQDLVAARRDLESKTTLVTQAGEETARLQIAVKSVAADLQKERERSARLGQDLTTARRDVESKTALVAKVAEDLSRLTSAGKTGVADLQKERERSVRLEQDLAAARRDSEAQAARAAKASEEVLLQRQAAEASAAELRQLRAESADVKAQNFFLSRSAIQAYEAQGRKGLGTASDASTTGSAGPDQSNSIAMAANPIADPAARVPARAVAQPTSEQVAEAAGLVTRANSLIRQGDVGAARLVLERAVEMGSAQASFALAETYDPLVLAKWGTYGTRGDASKARALYAKADAAGIKEAKARLDALRH